jgi:hypothetical protein
MRQRPWSGLIVGGIAEYPALHFLPFHAASFRYRSAYMRSIDDQKHTTPFCQATRQTS